MCLNQNNLCKKVLKYYNNLKQKCFPFQVKNIQLLDALDNGDCPYRSVMGMEPGAGQLIL